MITGADFTGVTDGGFIKEQFASTASYQSKDLRGIQLAANNLSGWDFSGQYLAGANFSWATVTNTDLSGAVVAGANFGEARGLTEQQLYSTHSYQAKDLQGIGLGGIDLTGWDFSGQNLTDGNFRSANLRNADLTTADARGAVGLNVTGAITTDLIRPDGRIAGLDLATGERLFVRNDDGVPGPAPDQRSPIHITIQDGLTMADDSVLQLLFDADSWVSLISFEPGIPVQLGGALELTFADDVDLAIQVGRTLRIFDWTGVSPFGQFQVASPYEWDLSKLYTTGEVTLLSANTVPGDYNGNGTVDAADYVLLRDHLGQSVTLPNDATPGTVAQADYEVWKSNFGHVANGGVAVATIPEPTTRIPMLIAIASFLARRHAKASRIVAD
jgi:hypothetical protein